MIDMEREREYAKHCMEKYGIKPCPFCGGSAYLEKHHRAFIDGQTTIVSFIRCVECNARSGREKLSDYGKSSKSSEAQQKVINKWNARCA